MTDFLALISDNQSKDNFRGVLICKRIVPNRLHWFVLEQHDLTLARGSVECAHCAPSAQACIDLVIESVAHNIGVEVDQIQVVRDSVIPVTPQNDYVAGTIEIASTSTETPERQPLAAPLSDCLGVPVGL